MKHSEKTEKLEQVLFTVLQIVDISLIKIGFTLCELPQMLQNK